MTGALGDTNGLAGLCKRLLRLRGIHWLATRFGPRLLRAYSFDEKYRSGDWNFSSDNTELARLVEAYSNGGHVLVLGCGTCPIARELTPGSFASLLGVDLSSEAIARARQAAGETVRFETGDMVQYRCTRRYDVILFSESLNYVPRYAREALLRRLASDLTVAGRIIVSISQPDRYASLLEMIRARFAVDESRPLESGGRWVMVFR